MNKKKDSRPNMPKGNPGGKRPGAGRKPRVVEKNINEAINAAIAAIGGDPLKDIWQKVIEEATKGSFAHVQLLLNYYYGKPKESVNVSGGLSLTINRKVV